MARPYAPALFVHSPPTTSWKWGTRRPPTLRLTPQKADVGDVVLAAGVEAAAAS